MSGSYTNTSPAEPTWSTEEIPDLKGKIMLVTGGDTSTGQATAKALLAHNAKVYIAGRSAEDLQAAAHALRAATGSAAHALAVDLADLRSVRAAAAEFQTKETQLHVVFNTAQVMHADVARATADGYDISFGANVLGHFYLTRLLLPLLLQTASGAPQGSVLVVTAASLAHFGVDCIEYAALQDGGARSVKGAEWLYAQSQFANVVVSNELHRMYAEQGIVAIALDPGKLETDNSKGEEDPAIYPASSGALTQLYAGTMPQAAEWGGKYVIPWGRLGDAKKETGDPEIASALWAWLESQIKGF